MKFEARDYLNYLQEEGEILRLARYDAEQCIGRGRALVLSREDGVAVMLEDCGSTTGIRGGDIVNFVEHPEAETKLVGSTASVRPN